MEGECQWRVAFWTIVISSIRFGSWEQIDATSTNGYDFFSQKEDQVIEIAKQAAINYDNTCDLVQTCNDDSDCSPQQCSPVQAEKYICEIVPENNQCTPACKSFRVFEQGGVVRLPNYLGYQSQVPAITRNSVCAQRMLDPNFTAMFDPAYFGNFYFGATDGSWRLFPGRVSNQRHQTTPNFSGNVKQNVAGVLLIKHLCGVVLVVLLTLAMNLLVIRC